MKKFIAVLLLLTNLGASTAFANDEIIITSHENRVWTRTYPELYKPSSIVLGKNNFFQIKANPFSKVFFVFAFEKFDIKDFLKNEKLTVQQKIVPANGLVKFELNFESTLTELKGKELYFNAVVVDQNDPDKVQIVKIIDDSRQEASNMIVISDSPRNLNTPTWKPSLMGIEKVIDVVNTIKQSENDEE